MVCFPYPKRMCANIDVDQGAARAAVLVRSGARGRRPRRPDGVPARGGRSARPLVRHRAVVARRVARHRDRGRRRARRGRHHASTTSRTSTSTRASRRRCRSRMRALGIADRRPAAAHRHRRARLRGRPGQQLPDARDRAHGRACCAPTRRAFGSRPRSAGTSRSTRPAVWSATPPAQRLPARRPGASQAEVDAHPRREPAGLVDGAVDDRGDVGRVRARRHPVGRHRHRAHRRRPAGDRQRPRRRRAARAHDRGAGKADRARSPTTARRTPRARDRRADAVRWRCNRRARGCCGAARPGAAPRCGSRQLFRRWFSMVPDCPRCGLHFEREAGLLDRRARDQHDPRRRRSSRSRS